jgi:deoxyribonuclease I
VWGYPPYYGSYTLDNPKTLKNDLFTILTSLHSRSDTQSTSDIIDSTCHSPSCWGYKILSYNEARAELFGYLHLLGDSHDTYSLKTYYCQSTITNKDLVKNDPLAPMNIPDHTVVNTEHVWPQSKFSKTFASSDQKGNLHILLPVLSRVNSTRGNHPMGKVEKVTSTPCPTAHLGKSAEGLTVFEPDDRAKGDVARALFYFSIRFKIAIAESEEKYLRQWHELDPVDAAELERNDLIFEIQHDRNPFIDRPELVPLVDNF